MFTTLLLLFRHKTPFWANSVRPCFCEVSVTGHDGGVSRDFEPGRMVYREGDRIIVKIPVRFRRRNGRQMIFAADEGAASHSKSEDNALALAIARAWKWQEELESGEYSGVEELASAKKIDVSYVRRMLRLNSLAPDIVEAILQNDAPDHLSLRTLYRRIPLSWGKQRRRLMHVD